MILLALALSATQPTRSQVMGVGTTSCGSFVVTKDKPVSRGIYIQWLMGFVSAYDVVNLDKITDVTAYTDVVGMTAWLDNYCEAHPIEPFATAADALLLTMKSEVYRAGI